MDMQSFGNGIRQFLSRFIALCQDLSVTVPPRQQRLEWLF
jgi:hypothetical protein